MRIHSFKFNVPLFFGLAIAVSMMTGGGCFFRGETRQMKILSYNVRHCRGMDLKLDLERTAERIRSTGAEYVGLQELDRCTTRVNGLDEPKELGRLLGMYPTFAKTIAFCGGEYGVMILSKEQPLRTVTKPLPGAEPRILLLCEFDAFWVGTTHLSVANAKERLESVALIREAISELPGEKPVFLTGDWNATIDSSVLKGMQATFQILSETGRQTFHGGKERDENGNPYEMSRYCIDYVAVDRAHEKDVRVLSTSVIEDRLTSDHAPLEVELSLRVK